MRNTYTFTFTSPSLQAGKRLLLCFITLIGYALVNPLSAQSLGSGSVSYSSIAVNADGKIYSWGANWYGQLGTGNILNTNTPQDISSSGSLAGKTIIKVASAYHTLALASDGTVHAWGNGGNGQLGNGNYSNSTTPIQVPNLTGVISVATSLYHSLALKSDGSVYAWGLGAYGQLGNGTFANSATPLKIANLSGVIEIAGGTYNSFALKSDGRVYAWGFGGYGQLGNNNYSSTAIPVQVNLIGITAIASGAVYSLALKSDGSVYAWGHGGYGQLGNTNFSSSATPARVVNLSGVTAIVGGSLHSLALKSDGTVYAWGYGYSGQLGNGNYYTSPPYGLATPVQVTNLAGVIAIASGAHHSLALRKDGTIYVWGRGYEGQEGNGNYYTSAPYGSATPVQVTNLNLGSGCSNPAPIFSVNPVCLGSVTSFLDESTNVDSDFDNQWDIDGDGIMDIDALYEWDVDGDGRMDYHTTGNIEHTYSSPGTYTAKLTIKQGTCEAEFTQQVIVKDLPTATLSGDAVICSGNNTNLEVVLTGTAPWSITYTGGTTPVTVSAETSPYNIAVSPTNNITYTLTNVSDATCTGNSLSGNATITVNTPPELTVPAISSVANETGVCGATVSFIASATGIPAPDITYAIGETIITSPHFFPVGTTKVTAVAVNSCGTATSSFDITVTNQAPVITSIGLSLDPRPVSVSIPVSVSFLDNNVVKSNIAWGDGSNTEGNLGTTNFTGDHTYTTPGVYTMEVKVTDACEVETMSTYQYVVIYDPYGGFVTGGGWFYSAGGAYVYNSQATGKASFGFVSKYQKGSSVPVGNTDFQFIAGDIKFKSTSYEWLVVAGYKAMYKGIGELNGSSGYGFLISAVDGEKNSSTSPDKFRIKVWDSSGSAVYDNQMGNADDAEATTSIGGGSIVIHDDVKSKTAATARTNALIDESPVHTEETAMGAYPNPFTNSITVEFHSAIKEEVNIHLLDITGKTLYNKAYNFNTNGLYQVDMTLQPLSQQLYFLKINQGRRIEFLKMIRK